MAALDKKKVPVTAAGEAKAEEGTARGIADFKKTIANLLKLMETPGKGCTLSLDEVTFG